MRAFLSTATEHMDKGTDLACGTMWHNRVNALLSQQQTDDKGEEKG